MNREITYDKSRESDIHRELLSLQDSEEVIVIRGASALQRGRGYWFNFLSNTCGFTLDNRHYDSGTEAQRQEWWEISNQPDKSNSYAHSTTPQPLHTDNAWFQDAAEVNFFIMEKQAESGGSQLIYPLSRILHDLENLNPSLLKDLSQTEVTISKGSDEHQNTTPIITLNDSPRIHWNYYRTLKEDEFIDNLCDRFFSFLKSREGTSSVSLVRCETGDAFAFNDKKILHGRTAFKASAPRDRVLVQSMWNL